MRVALSKDEIEEYGLKVSTSYSKVLENKLGTFKGTPKNVVNNLKDSVKKKEKEL